jgi:hypothetical protein
MSDKRLYCLAGCRAVETIRSADPGWSTYLAAT